MTDLPREEIARLREALRPFADIGQWLFARDLPDDTPVVEIAGLNGCNGALTRGDFKAAHTALDSLSRQSSPVPIDMILHCPACRLQHVDEPDERTPDWINPPHRSHLCHGCGHIWRPADVPTNGVREIKTRGKNDSAPPILPVGEGDEWATRAATILVENFGADWAQLSPATEATLMHRIRGALVSTRSQALREGAEEMLESCKDWVENYISIHHAHRMEKTIRALAPLDKGE